MRVLLISPLNGVVGGISIWTKNILQYLSLNNDVSVDLCDFSRTRSGQMYKSRIKKLILAMYDYTVLTIRAVCQICSHKGEVLHLSSSASYLLIRDYIILLFARSRYVSCIHFHFGRIPELAQKKNWEWILLKKVIRCANHAIVMDNASYDTLIQNGFTSTVLLPNPLSTRIQSIIDSVPENRNKRSLLFVGHCVPTKGIYELIDACKQISDITLKMVGAISASTCEQLSLRAGTDCSWLEICGQQSQEETIRHMKECDIFILPTYTEGFPNVIIESMACGCPIIASAVGAIPEMLEIEDGKHYGQLIQPKNADQIREAIERYLNDDVFKIECATNAQKRVKERYNIHSVGVKLVNIWEQMKLMG